MVDYTGFILGIKYVAEMHYYVKPKSNSAAVLTKTVNIAQKNALESAGDE